MVMYVGRHYDSAVVGSRILEVACEQCGCVYYYQLSRIGSGSADAPYGIGTKGASKSAADKAKRELDRRLADEAELVPCPKCQWINQTLVLGYRRSRYRGWGSTAIGFGVIGLVLSLGIAWFLSIGPAADRGALPIFLVVGPILSGGFAGSFLLLRHLLRKLIQPNRDYPLPPKVPLGNPPPLLLNPETGQLETAAPAKKPDEMDGAWVDFQVGVGTLPANCCECLGPATPGSAFLHAIRPALDLAIPLCIQCANRKNRRIRRGALISTAIFGAVGLPLLFVLRPDDVIFWGSIVGLFVVGPIVGAMIVERRANPVRVKIVDASRGVVLLWFRNQKYPRQATSN